MERFTLDGWTYYQQGRRCGRPGCRCQRGELHGPYWYRRHALSGAVEYVGRELPAAVAAARAAYLQLRGAVEAQRLELLADAAALERLLEGAALDRADQWRVDALGFGACLVHSPGRQVTQDDEGDL